MENRNESLQLFEIDKSIRRINISRIRFISPFILVFAILILLSDFIYGGVWDSRYIVHYRVLDIILLVFAVFLNVYLITQRNSDSPYHKYSITIFPLFILIWAGVITGVELTNLGFSTYSVVLLAVVFFLYTDLITSLIYFCGSFLALIVTIFSLNHNGNGVIPQIFVMLSIIVFAILLSWRSYMNKIHDLENTYRLESLNADLQKLKNELEIKVEERTKELELAKDRAEESDRLKTSFLNNLSHEIRTPLNSICGFSEILNNPDLSYSKFSEYTSIIHASAGQLLSIMNDILTISSLETGQQKTSFSKFNIKPLLNKLLHNFEPLAKAKGLEFGLTDSNNSIDHEIFSDYEKVRNILYHLLSNSLKFTKSGFVKFGYRTTAISIVFFVNDSGIGIDPANHDIIFQKFRQADKSIQILYGGNGLGLSICKGFADLIGGKIWLESELGKGATFFFEIPKSN